MQPDWQHQRGEAKTVAQLVGFVQRAQVDRHHGANLFAVHLVTQLAQIAANRPGHTAQQHVVDRTVQRLAHRFDFGQRNGAAPGHPFGGARFAFEAGGRVVGHQGQGSGVVHHLPGHTGHTGGIEFTGTHGFFRGTQRVQGASGPFTGHTQRLHGHTCQGFDQGVGNPVLGAFRCFAAAARRRRGTTVHQRHGDRDECNTVGNTVVDPHQQRTALGAVLVHIVLNQVELPQRAFGVERLHGQDTHLLLQHRLLGLPLARAGEFFAHHMVGQVEVAVGQPACPRRVFHHALGEAVVLEQPLLHPLTQGVITDAGLQRPHTHNHHQVAGRVHTQPGGIHLAHAFAV